MEKISGLKLDVFDDVDGEILRSMFPTYESLPALVKSASALPDEVRTSLPDDVFALVLHEEDVTLRKYACTDAGNVALNIAYLLSQCTLLPIEAAKTAAANLCTACTWYDIEPPDDLKKLSTGNIPVIGKQQVWKDMDGSLYGHDHQSWDLNKVAEVLGTPDMPIRPPAPSAKPKQSLAVVPKTAGADDILAEAFGIKVAEEPDLGAELPTKDNPESFPQPKLMKPHVDVTGKEPPKLITSKTAQFFCMPSIARYPIDTFEQVKAASEYFHVNHRLMVPADRREYAENLVKRASALRQPIDPLAVEYGSPGFAKKAHVDICLEARRTLLRPHAEQGDTEQEKQASVHVLSLYDDIYQGYGILEPSTFARTLEQIDKLAGIHLFWGAEVPDPYYSTFAKTAEEADPKDALLIGNEYMKVRDLQVFARTKSDALKGLFGCEFTKEFQADPAGIFNSLPVDQKKVIMRMVNNNKGNEGASTS